MIELKNIKKSFINKKKKSHICAIDDISLQFENYGFVSILGKSGSGKSSILNLICGLIKADSGICLIENKDISTFNRKEWDNLRCNYFSYIFQNGYLIQEMTVKENFKILINVNFDEDHFDAVLTRLNIYHLIHKKIKKLSGGEKTRVLIAIGLLKQSRILLVDEPTCTLDKKNAKIVFEILKEYSLKALVIVVTHDKALSNLFCDRLITLRYGKIESDITINVPVNKEMIEIKKKQIGWKKHIFLFKSLMNDIFNSILYNLMFALIIFLFLLLTNFTEMDKAKFEANAISASDKGYNLISSSQNKLEIREEILNIDKGEFTKTYFGNVYHNEKSTFNKFDKDLKEVEKSFFSTCIINDKLKDDELILTDYHIKIISPDIDESDLDLYYNSNLIFFGDTYKIVDIKNNHFNRFSSKDLEVDISGLHDVFEANQKTAEKIYTETLYRLKANSKKTFSEEELMIEANTHVKRDIFGAPYELKENEIFLSMKQAAKLFDYQPDQSSYEDWIKKVEKESIEIDLETEYGIIRGQFQIKIYSSDRKVDILFNESFYKKAFDLNFSKVKGMQQTYSIKINSASEYLRLKQDLTNKGLFVISPLFKDINIAFQNFQSMQLLFNVLTLIFIPIAIIIFITFIFTYLFQKKTKLAYLKLHGLKDKIIRNCLIIKFMVNNILASLIAFALIIIFNPVINDFISRKMEVVIPVSFIEPLHFFKVIGILLISSYVMIHLILYFIKKVDVPKLIRG